MNVFTITLGKTLACQLLCQAVFRLNHVIFCMRGYWRLVPVPSFNFYPLHVALLTAKTGDTPLSVIT